MTLLRLDPELAEKAGAAGKAVNVDLPEFAKRQIPNQVHVLMIVRTLKALADRFGDEVWKVCNESMYQLGREIGPEMKTLLAVDVNDARSLTRLVDATNVCLDIVGEEVVFTEKEVIRHEKECLLGPMMHAQDGHHYCMLFQTMYRGVLNELSKEAGCNNMYCSMSHGDDHCEVKTWVGKDDPRIPPGRY